MFAAVQLRQLQVNKGLTLVGSVGSTILIPACQRVSSIRQWLSNWVQGATKLPWKLLWAERVEWRGTDRTETYHFCFQPGVMLLLLDVYFVGFPGKKLAFFVGFPGKKGRKSFKKIVAEHGNSIGFWWESHRQNQERRPQSGTEQTWPFLWQLGGSYIMGCLFPANI